MKRIDVVEIVGAFILASIITQTLIVIGNSYHWPRIFGAYVCMVVTYQLMKIANVRRQRRRRR
jgi:hypothetical protein